MVNFAAETHVDRSILDAGAFIETDVRGTWVLLEAARKAKLERFLQVSTDEVYGHVPTGASRETDRSRPRSPYAASKAGGDLMVRAYAITYGLPVMITRGSNNIGPYQYPEKVVPLFVTNAIDDHPLPIYGDGGALRDYMHVTDHCAGIDIVLRTGTPARSTTSAPATRSTRSCWPRDLSRLGKPESLMTFVPTGRPRPPLRRGLLQAQGARLGPGVHVRDGANATVDWYVANEDWWRPIKSGEYLEYYQRNYGNRAALTS